MGYIYHATPENLQDDQYSDAAVDSTQRQIITTAPLSQSIDSVANYPANSTTGTPTSVNSSASSVTVLASNTNRKGALFFNDSTAVLYLLVGSGTASNTNYSVQVPAGGYYELPGPYIYNGIIEGIWASANGAVRVTELT